LVRAFIPINCQTGHEDHIISKLNKIKGNNDVNGVFGVCDIVTNVESETNGKQNLSTEPNPLLPTTIKSCFSFLANLSISSAILNQ